jgi:hypothetical protein
VIYGPYSTGWRSETERHNDKRRAGWVRLGVLLTLAAFGGSLKLLGVL